MTRGIESSYVFEGEVPSHHEIEKQAFNTLIGKACRVEKNARIEEKR